jgi:hypothetical protein
MREAECPIAQQEIDYFDRCILFFSPFIPGMPADQLEAAVIPGLLSDSMAFHGVHGDVYEYYLGPLGDPTGTLSPSRRTRAIPDFIPPPEALDPERP